MSALPRARPPAAARRAAAPRCRAAARAMAAAPPPLPYKVAVFSAAPYVCDFLEAPLRSAFQEVDMLSARLDADTARLAQGCDAACLFVNDDASEKALEVLAVGGVKTLAMRCAGYDRVDLGAAARLGLRVVRVPTYSPQTVAEHALALMMAAARHIPAAVRRVDGGNYALNGLVGTQISGKTVGVVGTGAIGLAFLRLVRGFDATLLAYDVRESDEAKRLGAAYVPLDELLARADVVSLHVPLLPSTRYLLNRERLARMKDGSILVNCSRGGLIDTDALVESLVGDSKPAAVGLDVYEGEAGIFFEDLSVLPPTKRMRVWDRRFAALKGLPQVIVTPHVAFLTDEALAEIARTTVENLRAAARGEAVLANEVKAV